MCQIEKYLTHPLFVYLGYLSKESEDVMQKESEHLNKCLKYSNHINQATVSPLAAGPLEVLELLELLEIMGEWLSGGIGG